MANTWGNNGKSDRLYFLGLQITADGDCSHETKRCLLLGRKAMTNLDSILKSWDITLWTVQFSRSVVSDSLWSHGLQHARPPCPSTTSRVYSNSCPLSHWCRPTISSSVIPFSRLHSFPASGSFLMSQLFTSGGQRIGVSVSASVLPVNIQDWFPLGSTS